MLTEVALRKISQFCAPKRISERSTRTAPNGGCVRKGIVPAYDSETVRSAGVTGIRDGHAGPGAGRLLNLAFQSWELCRAVGNTCFHA